MGTAGPLALAREILDDGSGSPFFVLNRCVPQAATSSSSHKQQLVAVLLLRRGLGGRVDLAHGSCWVARAASLGSHQPSAVHMKAGAHGRSFPRG